MDCERAIQAVLEAQDLGRAAVPDFAEAVAHCEKCESCKATARGLAAIGDVPAPRAPDGLADRVLTAVAAERAADVANAAIDASERRDGTTAAAAFDAPPVPLRGRPPWATWVTVGASAAATVVLAVGVARFGLSSLGVRTEADTDIVTSAAAPEAAEPYRLATPGAPDEAASAEGGAAAPATAPGFIRYDDRVWRVSQGMTADPSTLTEAGEVRTDLGTGDSDSLNVYERPGDEGLLFVEDGDDVMHGFTIVTRLYRGNRFALAAGPGLAEFGDWPELPPSVSEPTSDDGSPTFDEGGTDDLGVTVYPLAGTEPDAGFAIAPGTQSTDPAAGNPNWTWWAPYAE